MKWELALKFLNEFDSKKALTKINDPEEVTYTFIFRQMKTILKTCPLLTNGI